MQFSRAFRNGLARDAQGIFDVVRVSVRLARRAVEPAEFAINVADVRGIEMAVVVEVKRAAMLLPGGGVWGVFPKAWIVRRGKSESLVGLKTLSRVGPSRRLPPCFV